MRRQAERLLEGPAEIVRTQPGQPRESRERDRLCEMVFDVGGDDALLPGGQPPPCRRFGAWHSGIKPDKLMRQDGAQSFEVGTAVGTCALDQGLELEPRCPPRGVLREQPRGQKARPD